MDRFFEADATDIGGIRRSQMLEDRQHQIVANQTLRGGKKTEMRMINYRASAESSW
jgi:hypothetical protein